MPALFSLYWAYLPFASVLGQGVRVTEVADGVGQAGAVIAVVGGFVLLLAALSRPWLGRRVSERPLREVLTSNPFEFALLFLWRQWRWAMPALVVGCILTVIGLVGSR